jgi:lactate dehydrogenase-like 2-hydroxyacid dehydrogenase
VTQPRQEANQRVVVCVPDLPERRLMGEFPANVELVLIPKEPEPLPDLGRVDMIIPTGRVREPLIDVLRDGGRVRVIQTLSAGFEWLVGHVPERVTVCNAKGVFDRPVAEWVVGSSSPCSGAWSAPAMHRLAANGRTSTPRSWPDGAWSSLATARSAPPWRSGFARSASS